MQQLDAETGAVIVTWPSCAAASHALGGGLHHSISLVARHGVDAAGGYRWRFAAARSAEDDAAGGDGARSRAWCAVCSRFVARDNFSLAQQRVDKLEAQIERNAKEQARAERLLGCAASAEKRSGKA